MMWATRSAPPVHQTDRLLTRFNAGYASEAAGRGQAHTEFDPEPGPHRRLADCLDLGRCGLRRFDQNGDVLSRTRSRQFADILAREIRPRGLQYLAYCRRINVDAPQLEI